MACQKLMSGPFFRVQLSFNCNYPILSCFNFRYDVKAYNTRQFLAHHQNKPHHTKIRELHMFWA